MNQGEARLAGRLLEGYGYQVTEEGIGPEEPDTYLIFTCFVIEPTERRMWKRIEKLNERGKRIVVGGCMAAVKGKDIKARYPEVELMDTMGVENTERSVSDLFGPKRLKGFFNRSPGRSHRIVPISTGCLGNCSYCITRLARRKLVSRDPGSIITDVREGVEEGNREILLTSQDNGVYGKDRPGGTDLGSLLDMITGEVSGDYRIRVGMMNPRGASDNLESIMSGFRHGSVFKFFHIPVQSGSDGILKAMGRPYSVEEFEGLIHSIRENFPDLTLSTDIIVGYPGETPEDFKESVSLIEGCKPDVLNITRFSARPGTRAYDSDEGIPGWVLKERSREMTRTHERIVRGVLRKRLGEHESCLVTEIGKPGTMMARDRNYTPIVIRGDKSLLGRFVDIVTTEVGSTYLMGGDWDLSPME